MITPISTNRLSGAETALQLLRDNVSNSSQQKNTTVKEPSITSVMGNLVSAATSDSISRIQEIVSGKIDLNKVQTGSVYHDTMTNLCKALRESATVASDGTITANPNMSEDELKELFIEIMKSHISQGMIDNPDLVNAIQSGNFELVLQDEMKGNPIFPQGSFKVVGDGYGWITDTTPRSEADIEAINAFQASGKRVNISGVGPLHFGIIY